MPSVPIAGSPDHFTLPNERALQAQAWRRRFTATAEALSTWLQRLAVATTLVALAVKYVTPSFTMHALIVFLAFMGLILLMALLIHLGERFGFLDKQKKKALSTALSEVPPPKERPAFQDEASPKPEASRAAAQAQSAEVQTAEVQTVTIKNLGTFTYRTTTIPSAEDSLVSHAATRRTRGPGKA